MKQFIIYLTLILLVGCYSNSSNKIKENLTTANKYYSEDKYKLAKDYFLKVADSDSVTSEVYYKLGVCYAYLFEYETSIAYYKKAVENNYRLEDAYFNIGLNLICLSKDSLALISFGKALEYAPNDNEIIKEIDDCKKRLGINSIDL